MTYRSEELPRVGLDIVVLGVGGGGSNTVTNLYRRKVPARLIAVDTDVNTLSVTKAHALIQIGETVCRGRGTGGDIAKGRKAAEEDIDKVLEAVKRPDLLIAVCGLGGGTGSGALPYIVSELKKSLPDLVVGVIGDIPFKFEGLERIKNAQVGIKELLPVADFIVVNMNDMLLDKYGSLPVREAFRAVDLLVANAIESLLRCFDPKGSIKHVDFSDFVSAVKGSGLCMMGFGRHRMIRRALENAIENRLLDADPSSAKGALLLVQAPVGTSLKEAMDALRALSEKYYVERILWGLRTDPELRESSVLLIASGVRSKTIEDWIGEVELLQR